ADQTFEEWRSRVVGRLVAAHAEEDRTRLSRLELETVDRLVGRELVGGAIERQGGDTSFAVEATIGQQDAVAADHAIERAAAPRAAQAPHLEQIGKIALEVE